MQPNIYLRPFFPESGNKKVSTLQDDKKAPWLSWPLILNEFGGRKKERKKEGNDSITDIKIRQKPPKQRNPQGRILTTLKEEMLQPRFCFLSDAVLLSG